MSAGAAIGFWRTVGLLLAASRRRADGRGRRQRDLLDSRGGGTDWGFFGLFLGFFFYAFIHGLAAVAVGQAVKAEQYFAAERQGRAVAGDGLIVAAEFLEGQAAEAGRPSVDWNSSEAKDQIDGEIDEITRDLADDYGGDRVRIGRHLREAVAAGGSRALVARDTIEVGLPGLSGGPALLATFVLLWWFAMLACQGEGLELDTQRRRHPMWEWLLSHPVRPGAVFLAEMLAPLSANPAFWAAPVFAGFLFGQTYGEAAGLLAALLAGIPLTLAAACLGKALEVGAMLRLSPRSRGAVIGLLSWFGFVSTVLLIFFAMKVGIIASAIRPVLDAAAAVPLPLLGLILGLDGEGGLSFVRGIAACWAISALVIAFAVWFTARSLRGGMAGAGNADTAPRRRSGKPRLGKRPLFRKEMLWFLRDRGAIVQALLIPISLAALQVFNLRFLASHATESWNYLSGAAILFGTYFLWVLGPKSLVSEGAALWIALTWPKGLEDMLKAKAWLWALLSSGLVFLVLAVALWLFPHDAWKIALVGLGWYLFARTMAEKSVTLVTITSESGETEKVPAGRRWAAQLGMLSFAIGIITQQWQLAIVGIVYSWLTAAAMWENLRARLPYLYDPWSERLPAPPTLMHAMIGITVLIECAAILTALLTATIGREGIAAAMVLGYALCVVGVGLGMAVFLDQRGVHQRQIWSWNGTEPGADADEEPGGIRVWLRRYVAGSRQDLKWLALGLVGGIALALLAQLYILGMSQIPMVGEALRESERQFRSLPGLFAAYAVLAVLFAPFAEEYLFRGLLYRALDKQWGGWAAVLGAAAFFAIYHPPLAWVPVGIVGAVNCLLFKRAGRLAPAVVLHMAYNAVIVAWM